MSSATKSVPLFQLGDWVSFLVGSRRVLAQVIEDRGPLGTQGRRIYGLQLEQGDDGEGTIEMPEADLDLAPPITTAELAIEHGLSTQNWPRQAFHATYTRSNDGTEWKASVRPVRRTAVPPMRGPGGLTYADDANRRIIRVDLEYDPRLDDPQTNPEIWTSLTAGAARVADEVFKANRPRARVIHEPAVPPR
jgi:hypothetical protein